ncbi:MAG: XdhC family aldehyde oxidoreductase maturation factor [Thermodesulfobacteriota bacterium]
MDVKEIVREAVRLLEKGQGFALATVVEQAHSAPRSAGARMVIGAEGAVTGTVGGGALEARVQALAAEVMTRRGAVLVSFNLTAGDSSGMGMICGGQVRVLIDYIDPGDPAALPLYRELAAALESAERAWLVTLSPPEEEARSGRTFLMRADGSISGIPGDTAGDLGDLLDEVRLCRAFTYLDERRAVIDSLGYRGTALIFGAGHVGKSLVPVLASLDFRTVILDDRQEFASPERFGSADRIVQLDSFEDAFRGVTVDEQCYIVIVTRGHLHDRTVLGQSLRTKAAYIGMIGSRTKRDLTFQALLDDGFVKADLERVHCPIGIPIKAETPAEIAVSIAAELIRIRAELNG